MFRGKAYTFNPERLNKMWGHGARAGDKEKRKASRMKKREELRNNLKALQGQPINKTPPSRSSTAKSRTSIAKTNNNGNGKDKEKKPAKTKGHAFSSQPAPAANNASDWRNRPMLAAAKRKTNMPIY